MNALTVELHKARDSEECYAVRAAGDKTWRAVKGFGSDFEPIWNIEFQGTPPADLSSLHWEPILERAVEAYRLSDPVMANVDWREFSVARH